MRFYFSFYSGASRSSRNLLKSFVLKYFFGFGQKMFFFKEFSETCDFLSSAQDPKSMRYYFYSYFYFYFYSEGNKPAEPTEVVWDSISISIQRAAGQEGPQRYTKNPFKRQANRLFRGRGVLLRYWLMLYSALDNRWHAVPFLHVQRLTIDGMLYHFACPSCELSIYFSCILLECR